MAEEDLHADAEGFIVAVDGGPVDGLSADAGTANSGDDRGDDLLTQDEQCGDGAGSVGRAARITGLSRDLLDDQMRVGKLDCLKVGRRRIITLQNLEIFLSSSTP